MKAIDKTKQFLKGDTVSVGKYNVGLPFTESYKKQTPKPIKIAGEVCLFIGGAITIVAGALSLPAWVIVAGGISSLAGRHIAKMFSEK